jgi:hypothetical protein
MEWTLNTFIFGGACGVGGFGLACLCGLRGKVSDIVLSRAGLRVHTNSWAVMFEIMSNVDQTGAFYQKAMRKATAGLTLLDIEKYDMSTDAMLINREANILLMHAVTDNHHTSELEPDGIEAYIADKVHDISIAIRVWRKKFPELPNELIEDYVCHWLKTVVLPNIRRACNEELRFYNSLLKKNSIIEALKEKIRELIKKNEGYVENIVKLTERFGNAEKSTIFPKEKPHENNRPC